MSVGVVARQGLVVEPYYSVGTEPAFQFLLNLLLSQGLISVGCHQAAAGGVDGTPSVALDGASLEYEVVVVLVVDFEERGVRSEE